MLRSNRCTGFTLKFLFFKSKYQNFITNHDCRNIKRKSFSRLLQTWTPYRQHLQESHNFRRKISFCEHLQNTLWLKLEGTGTVGKHSGLSTRVSFDSPCTEISRIFSQFNWFAVEFNCSDWLTQFDADFCAWQHDS